MLCTCVFFEGDSPELSSNSQETLPHKKAEKSRNVSVYSLNSGCQDLWLVI